MAQRMHNQDEDDCTVLADDAQGELATRLTARDARGRTRLIRRWVREAATRFDHAPLRLFVPILVERAVRGRLLASPATPEDPETPPPSWTEHEPVTAQRAVAVPDPRVGAALSEASQFELTRRMTIRHAPGNPARSRLIGRWVHEAAARFDHAPQQAFVPVLVEHAVRERLLAAAAPS